MPAMDFATARAATTKAVAGDGLVVAEWGFGDDELFVMIVGEPAFIRDGDSSAMLLDDTVWIVDRATGVVSENAAEPGSALAHRVSGLSCVGDVSAQRAWRDRRRYLDVIGGC